jgi:hypothetical protein
MDDIRWLSTNTLAERFDKTTRTLGTWERTRPNGFPLPARVNGRKFWREDEIVAWEKSLIASKLEAR